MTTILIILLGSIAGCALSELRMHGVRNFDFIGVLESSVITSVIMILILIWMHV